MRRVREGTYHWEDVPVCLCGSTSSLPIAAQDRFGIPVGFVVCVECGLARTTPRLAAADLPTFYNIDYHALHMGIDSPTPETALYKVGQGTQIYAYLSPHLSPGPLFVAEVGAGSGQVLREFARAALLHGHVVDVVGCDYSERFVAAGQQVGTDMRVGGIESLDGIPSPDVVIMSHVLEHFADPVEELSRLRKLTQPGSLLYVEVPGLLSLHEKAQYEFELGQYLTLAHTYHFTLETLVQTLSRSGFRLLKGDQEVRAVFERDESVGPHRVQLDPSLAGTLLKYLHAVERSPRLRLRTSRLRWSGWLRRRIRTAGRLVLGGGPTEEARWPLARALWAARRAAKSSLTLLGRFGPIHGALMATDLLRRRSAVRFFVGGRRYWMANDSAAMYHITNSIEPLQRLAAYVRPTDTEIIDVGGHSGLFAAFAAERAPGARITILEPDPDLAPVIRANLARRGRYRLVQQAAGERVGRARFFRNANSTQTSSLLAEAVTPFGGATSEFAVELTTLDALLKDIPHIDVLKIDVQGTEALVLSGARQVLERVRTLLIEVTVLDRAADDLLTPLTALFGSPERVNDVAGGADFAFVRPAAPRSGVPEHSD
jgi:FkbM family methyltransferase